MVEDSIDNKPGVQRTPDFLHEATTEKRDAYTQITAATTYTSNANAITNVHVNRPRTARYAATTAGIPTAPTVT